MIKRLLKTIIPFGARIFRWIAVALSFYFGVLIIGLIPINNDFTASKDGVTIYLTSSAVHADIIVPIKTDSLDWQTAFSNSLINGDISNASHIAFGWGDRGFFLETETWEDLKLSVGLKALFLPSQSSMHVSFMRPEHYLDKVAVTITQKQYQKLSNFIDRSFAKGVNGEYVQIQGYAYWNNDAFFNAQGHYHLFNTCNSWVGRALRESGIRVPWFTPLPKTPMLYLDN